MSEEPTIDVLLDSDGSAHDAGGGGFRSVQRRSIRLPAQCPPCSRAPLGHIAETLPARRLIEHRDQRLETSWRCRC